MENAQVHNYSMVHISLNSLWPRYGIAEILSLPIHSKTVFKDSRDLSSQPWGEEYMLCQSGKPPCCYQQNSLHIASEENICSSCRTSNNWFKMFSLLVSAGQRCPQISWKLAPYHSICWYLAPPWICLKVLLSSRSMLPPIPCLSHTQRQEDTKGIQCFLHMRLRVSPFLLSSYSVRL